MMMKLMTMLLLLIQFAKKMMMQIQYPFQNSPQHILYGKIYEIRMI